jgi:death-on-curing family protein
MGRHKPIKVIDLVKTAGIDPEDVLLKLWGKGIDYVNDLNDLIKTRDLSQAYQVLEISRKLNHLSYWQKKFNLKKDDFEYLLLSLGINMSPRARTLPKGAVKKLKQELDKQVSERTLEIQVIEQEIDVEKTPEFLETQWREIGHRKELRLLTFQEVLGIHYALVEDFSITGDPIIPPGTRDDHFLHSAIFRQHTKNASEVKYPTVEMSCAALLHSLILDHPFHNGNKRTALVSALVLLDENGFMLTCSEDEVFQFVLKIAQHQICETNYVDLPDQEVLDIAQWINRNSRNIERGERTITYRKLKQILSHYNCSFEHVKAQCKMKISRTIEIPKKGLFGRKYTKQLVSFAHYVEDGRDVRKSTINKIRADLQLDEEHGVDSAGFYDSSPLSVDDFIISYRKILMRLAKL